jgi:hypothetical protein
MTLPAQPSPRVAALLRKILATRARLIFAIDATASREPTWDMAAQLQTEMFQQVASIGGLEVQLVWYRGADECSHSAWTADPSELAAMMSGIRCAAGETKIGRVLQHIRAEHQQHGNVAAAVFIGDACEEEPCALFAAASGLSAPVFTFQEGNGLALYTDRRGDRVIDHPPRTVETVFRGIALSSGGAYARFSAGAAAQLGEMLRAVAAFAVGGRNALANLRTESARKLLTQMK